jgi:hypothetical protein
MEVDGHDTDGLSGRKLALAAFEKLSTGPELSGAEPRKEIVTMRVSKVCEVGCCGAGFDRSGETTHGRDPEGDVQRCCWEGLTVERSTKGDPPIGPGQGRVSARGIASGFGCANGGDQIGNKTLEAFGDDVFAKEDAAAGEIRSSFRMSGTTTWLCTREGRVRRGRATAKAACGRARMCGRARSGEAKEEAGGARESGADRPWRGLAAVSERGND